MYVVNHKAIHIISQSDSWVSIHKPFSRTFYVLSLSLSIFILHRLRNKFLQLTGILISLDFASWELHRYSCRIRGTMKNPKVKTRSRDSNSGPYECEADALPRYEQFLLFPQSVLPFQKAFCHFYQI